ncbi:MAG: winged helix-turn-helix domain-containing protein [Candidatus Latescibacteria bacterium]|nr:winged helix-turn-helix domain-containing protein [Candidatus Latescibacterota bacterium]
MSATKTQVTGYRFDDFSLDVRNRQLWHKNRLLPLNSKYFDVLVLLISHRGQLVEKRRIFEEIWDSVFVTDAALTQCIKAIRKQLGDDVANPRYIKTIPKHGYLFIGQATQSTAETVPLSSDFSQSSTAIRPYKFLDYYTEQDVPFFFGREPEIDLICSNILAHRSLILHGRSGVGKSSILRAGLMPRLTADGHFVFVIRSFIDPLHQMMNALEQESGVRGQGSEEDSSGGELAQQTPPDLKEWVERVTSPSPARSVIFLLDQFEEFFTLLPEESQRRLIEAIGPCVSNDALPVRFVFVLREDLLAEMSLLKPAIPDIFHHEYRLRRLSREQAARAIIEPARAVGCHYETPLVERLLDDLSEQDGVDPPHLQIVCDTLYDARDSAGGMTLAAYDRLGTASHILAGYLERVLRRFNATDLAAVQEILVALISADGQRLILRASDLEGRLSSRVTNGSAPLPELIEELVAARVVRRRSQDGDGWLELAHECLISEVSRWLTTEAYELKRAREVVERALENYRAHALIIDADTLDLLVPFGEQLGLTGEEADLLTMSLLNRAQPVPEWLVPLAPSAPRLIAEASRHPDPDVRLCAVEACRLVRDDETRVLLRHLSLWDDDLGVRKAASIALADWFGTAVDTVLDEGTNGEHVGRIRRAISLAIIRDYEKRLISLPHLPLPVGLLVVLGLVWVRLRRNGAAIIRQGVGGMFGGAASGLMGGLLLGGGLTVARHTGTFEATSLIFVLSCLGTFIGALGGSGVSFGMVTVGHITYRHSRWWAVLGGAAGGAAIGGSIKLLGVDTLKTLFGQNLTTITGAFEGMVIGAGISLGVVVTGGLMTRGRSWRHIIGAAVGAMCAGIVLTIIGGNLFSSSLEIVARSFADSQIRMDPLAAFFGEVYFGRTTQIALGALEGLLFGSGMVGGIEALARRRE